MRWKVPEAAPGAPAAGTERAGRGQGGDSSPVSLPLGLSEVALSELGLNIPASVINEATLHTAGRILRDDL